VYSSVMEINCARSMLTCICGSRRRKKYWDWWERERERGREREMRRWHQDGGWFKFVFGFYY